MRNILIAVAAVSFSLPASAAIITFEYTGTVKHLQEPAINAGPGDASVAETTLIPGSVRVGDSFRGRFSFDSAAPGYFSGVPFTQDYGRYLTPAVPAATLRFDHSGLALASHALMPLVQLGLAGGDPAAAGAYVAIDPGFGAAAQFRFGLSLRDGAAGALQGYALPTSFNLADFATRELNLTWYGEGSNSVGLRGDLASLVEVSAVPEPSSWVLIGAGLAGIGAGALRRRRA